VAQFDVDCTLSFGAGAGNVTSCQAELSDLPDEVLLKIFSYVPTYDLVMNSLMRSGCCISNKRLVIVILELLDTA
jgi:F-box-like